MVEGERILGRFTVGEQLGRGGNGTVHRAWDERLCRHVAVKAVEGQAGGRVLREAHAAARLNHPGIVTLYELGNENGTAYLVSELVAGSNLRERAAAGVISDRDVAEIGAEVCLALAHAHAQGVVHRDLKPDNVLVRSRSRKGGRVPETRAMLADFGIAAVADEPTLTRTGQVVGTLAYMSPEQAGGETVGPPSDVYSLALTLYELWAGFNPVAAATPAATARRIGTELPSLAEVRPELPPALHATIDAALAPEPEDRPAVTELGTALAAVAGGLHPERPVPVPLGEEIEEPAAGPPPARPFAVLIAAAALSTVGLLAGLGGLALVGALLLAPAALLLGRPREWIEPVLAPLLGLLGLAPLYLVRAARHERPAARAALAALAWAWTAIAATIVGHALGVTHPGTDGGWAGSAAAALHGPISPLLGADAVATLLIWVGAAVLLGAAIDLAGPALLAIAGLVWAAGLVAALGAVGGPAAPSLLLTPALLASVAALAWDRAGRPWPSEGLALRGAGAQPAEAARPRRPAAPLPALGDERARATRAASRHVRAALHGAGSRAGLP